MKLDLLAVGRVRGVLGEAVAEYERRVGHYFSYRATEVREEPARGSSDDTRVRNAEGERLLARLPANAEVWALHRSGEALSSEQLASYLAGLPHRGVAGATFVIGGAFGLSQSCFARADRLLSLSAFTLPHELARLVLVEQLYRAGTIARGEPYHKGRNR